MVYEPKTNSLGWYNFTGCVVRCQVRRCNAVKRAGHEFAFIVKSETRNGLLSFKLKEDVLFGGGSSAADF